MPETYLAATEIDAVVPNLESLSPLEVADLCLGALALRAGAGLAIVPERKQHVIQLERAAATMPIAYLPSELAEAAVARLCILAGLDVSAGGGALGRLPVRMSDSKPGAAPAELLVGIRHTPDGLGAELRRILGRGDDQPMSIHPGSGRDDVAGHYRLLETIGEGGMGVVYRAEHLVLEKRVALKVLRPELAADPTLSAQMQIEARAACRASHPGIIDVTDFGYFADGRAYIVMELVQAPTLASVLQDGPLEPRRALAIARRIAEALAAAAAQGVVHRDLKPANVFVGERDSVKIGDFGVARLLDSGTRDAFANLMVGTVHYAAPEQALGEAADTRSDLYSLGCVLFEMLTGKVPFGGKSAVSIIKKHVGTPVPDAIGRDGAVPPPVQHLIQRATAKGPEERFQNAEEMIAAIDRALRALERSDWRRWLPR